MTDERTHEGCGGRLVSSVELDYLDDPIEPAGGILVCEGCLVAVDPRDVEEDVEDPVAEGEREREEAREQGEEPAAPSQAQ